MSGFRFMRVMVFFDLPVETGEERHAYYVFRKTLIKAGFIMLQESVYCKMITSPSSENAIKNLLEKNKPEKGLIQILTITEKQFVKMEYLIGTNENNIIDSEESLIVL